MSAAILQQIGKYQIVREIDKGGMGVVYQAFDPDIERTVAIKMLLKQLLDDQDAADYLERFKREAQAAARCLHQNIVTVLEYGQHDGAPYIVMEYVAGTSLESLLRRKVIGLKAVIRIMGDMLRALHAAHSANIVHRDIKPANIMLLKDGTAKLADFGIARIEADNKLTQAGMVVGTPKYMAPEQAMAMPTDHRADLFSLAVIFLDLLQSCELPQDVPLGRLPDDGNLPNTMGLRMDRPLPAALVPLCAKALDVAPHRRFQSAKALAAALKEALGRLKSATGNITVKVPLDAETETQIRATETDAFEADDLTPTGFFTITGQTGIASGIDESTMIKLRSDLDEYLGEDSQKRLNAEMEDAISFAELILGLADAIKKPRQREKFLANWLDD